jgi:aminobenzoyl-glutamate utilization protein B
MDVGRWIEQEKAKIVSISDQVWQFAETAMKERKSAAVLSDALEREGFHIQRGVAGMPTAFVAQYGQGHPVIGILGEYDALPGLDQEVNPFQKSMNKGEPGHGCGHNLLGAAAYGAVLAVKEAIDTQQLRGTIRYYGCPAEETGVGKAFMVRDGLFDDVDISLTWHPGGANYVKLASNQAVNSVKFKFTGRTAHAAGDPWNGRSALDAVELMNIGANYLREHIITDARIHYVITQGGLAPNIVPEFAEVWYFVRAPQRHQVDEIYERLVNIAHGAAQMTETAMQIEFLSGIYNTLANETVAGVMHENLEKVGPPKFTSDDIEFAKSMSESISIKEKRQTLQRYGGDIAESLMGKYLCDIIIPPFGKGQTMGGSTDVADVSWVTPTGELYIACCPLGVPGHSWQITASSGSGIGHRGLLTAAATLAMSAIDFMINPELVSRAKQEFLIKTKDNPYKSAMPTDIKPPIE